MRSFYPFLRWLCVCILTDIAAIIHRRHSSSTCQTRNYLQGTGRLIDSRTTFRKCVIRPVLRLLSVQLRRCGPIVLVSFRYLKSICRVRPRWQHACLSRRGECPLLSLRLQILGFILVEDYVMSTTQNMLSSSVVEDMSRMAVEEICMCARSFRHFSLPPPCHCTV